MRWHASSQLKLLSQLLAFTAAMRSSATLLGDAAGAFGGVLPWPYTCQAPLAQGQQCELDGDCMPQVVDSEGRVVRRGQHCHVVHKVCSQPLEKGEPCMTGLACGPGLGCRAHPDTRHNECHTVVCKQPGDCVQGTPTGQACESGQDCPSNQVCNTVDTTPALGSGVCWDLPTKEGEDCSSMISAPYCAAGLVCLRGSGVCGLGGKEGQPCPMWPDMCDTGLACFNDPEPPFGTACLRGSRVGASCFMGGECQHGAYCDNHDLTCRAVVGVGQGCPNGNECGEAMALDQTGMDCVRGVCVDTSVEGGSCWPHQIPSKCTGGRVCRNSSKALKAAKAYLRKKDPPQKQEVVVDPL